MFILLSFSNCLSIASYLSYCVFFLILFIQIKVYIIKFLTKLQKIISSVFGMFFVLVYLSTIGIPSCNIQFRETIWFKSKVDVFYFTLNLIYFKSQLDPFAFVCFVTGYQTALDNCLKLLKSSELKSLFIQAFKRKLARSCTKLELVKHSEICFK